MTKNKIKKYDAPPKVSQETKNTILAVLLFGVAAILILAGFQKAGIAGKFIYAIFTFLFGWGYYFFPLLAILIAILLIFSYHKKIIGPTLIGGALLILSILGFMDVIWANQAGFIGKGIGAVKLLLGNTASIILMGTFILASLFLTLNASIRLKKNEIENNEIKIPEKSPEKPVEIIVTEPTKHMADSKTSEITEVKVEKKAEPKIETSEEIQVKTSAIKTAAANQSPKIKKGNYVHPPLSLLKSSVEKPSAGDLRANANIIKRTLDSFGIPVEMGEINIGPKVTRYTLKPAEGIKLSRITALNQDLALALAAHPIRIEAPIPGKSLVGIEVPNKAAAIVRLGSLIAYEDFQRAGPLAIILGRDVSGEAILTDIEKMPHLLVAGATGSGKSVCIHALLVSLLYKNSPEIMRLILIDPKRVELSIYHDIPHLIAPVITDGKKSISALRWAIQEMERRYEILLGAGSRDIISYNKSHHPPLPYLLIVIDEMADLMAAYGREVEASIVRLAQMARATGIHLIVSTQRPSVEVITGLIKANITSRIALQVASQVDSRTILDIAGAEKLLGGGDMLFISSDFSKPKRIQGAYISEEEIHAVTDFIREHNTQNEMTVEADLTAAPSNIFEETTDNDIDDELYDEAVRIVREAKKASASLLQRRLKIGYARAARLLDIMEAKGVVGPADGAKPREVYGQEYGTQQ